MCIGSNQWNMFLLLKGCKHTILQSYHSVLQVFENRKCRQISEFWKANIEIKACYRIVNTDGSLRQN